jgi:flagellar motor switch protein FliM
MFSATSKPPTAGPVSQTMSEPEVERLLSLVNDGDSAAAEAGPAGGEPRPGQDLISRHDFPQLSSFSDDEMRKLRMRCEAFVHSLAARLSVHLGLECAVQMSELEAARFEPFVAKFAHPTHLILFRLEPLGGVCLLNIPSRLALTLVDRELGGPAACQEEIRDLTQIEARLAAKVVGVMLGEWCNTWADTLQLRPVLIRHETSGSYLQTSAPATTIFSLGMETHVAQTVEQMQIVFPQSVLEPLLLKLNSNLRQVENPGAAEAKPGIQWNPGLNDVPIKVTARWHGMELTARQLLGLKPGDVVPLRQATASQVEITLDSTPKFAGQLGTCGQQMAIKIVAAL